MNNINIILILTYNNILKWLLVITIIEKEIIQVNQGLNEGNSTYERERRLIIKIGRTRFYHMIKYT